MDNSSTYNEILSLFDFKEQQEKEQTDDYDLEAGNQDSSKPKFDEISNEISDSIKECVKNAIILEPEKKDEIIKNTIKKDESNDDSIIDKEDQLSPNRPISLNKPGESSNGNEEKQHCIMPKIQEKNKMLSDQFIFTTASTSEKFNEFYSQKRMMLDLLLRNGVIPVDRYMDELKKSSVVLDKDVVDPFEIQKQMTKVQQLRERITQMSIEVNDQYFRFRRTVELLEGVLARIEYEKPVIKQSGLIFTHMGDMSDYSASLEALYASISRVEKTLEAASDCLSRKITVTLSEQSYRSKTDGMSMANRQSKSLTEFSLDSFDKLSTNTQNVKADSDEEAWENL